jgi:putative membrane protein
MHPRDPLHKLPPHGWEESSLSALPFVGSVLLLILILLLALTAFYLWRRGSMQLPKLGRAQSPEAEAKSILAERFARGDMTSDEFLERSSILNWTPGADPVPPRRSKKSR